MLTKSDLEQIGKVIDGRLDQKLKPIEDRLRPIENRLGTIEDRLRPIENRLGTIEDRLRPIENRLGTIEDGLGGVQRDLKDVKKRVIRIDKTLNVAVKAFDEEDVKMAKRIMKIEQHLNFPS